MICVLRENGLMSVPGMRSYMLFLGVVGVVGAWVLGVLGSHGSLDGDLRIWAKAQSTCHQTKALSHILKHHGIIP